MTEVASPLLGHDDAEPVGGSQNGHPRASVATLPITLFPIPSTTTMSLPLRAA